MRKMKIIIGLTSIVLCVLICAQSFVINIYNTQVYNSEFTLTVDLYYALFLLIVGIIILLDRNSTKRRIAMVSIVLYLLSMLVGLKYLGNFGNLHYYAYVCFIFSLMLLAELFKQKIANNKNTNNLKI